MLAQRPTTFVPPDANASFGLTDLLGGSRRGERATSSGAERARLRVFEEPMSKMVTGGFDALPIAAEATQPNVFSEIVSAIKAEAVDDLLLTDAAMKRKGITQAVAIPGEVRAFRTLTIADRLDTSAALEAKSTAVRTKAETIAQIQRTSIWVYNFCSRN